mmetsp:Transcript_33490/g.106182  ORF Transcript_33490/g.106182 Transcript_33490/m.106182 type:complete len:135 (+) Transcript_33490:778-1182(+)
MCLTLSMSEPKMSAASESVRSRHCSQARRVSLLTVAAVRCPSGGGPISSISISRTTQVLLRGPALDLLARGDRVETDVALSSAVTLALGLTGGVSGGAPVSATGSQMNPQLSPNPDGVGQHSLGLRGTPKSLGL